MKTIRNICLFIASLILPSTSFAYLDPGTGSMILQGLIAGIAMAAMTIKLYWYKFVGFFKKQKSNDETLPPVTNVEEKENS